MWCYAKQKYEPDWNMHSDVGSKKKGTVHQAKTPAKAPEPAQVTWGRSLDYSVWLEIVAEMDPQKKQLHCLC